MEHVALKDFCNLYSLNSLINKPSCRKNLSKPYCIDLILTNRPKYFQNSNIIETELSDFHEMAVTIVKTTFRKLKPKIICYRKYKHFSNYIFRDSFLEELSQVRISNNADGFNNCLKNCRNTLDKLAPRKKSTSVVTTSFIDKTLIKEIMKRSNQRNMKMKMVENEKIVTDDKKIVKVLNDFFSNIIKTLNILQTNYRDSNFENVGDPILKAILKYRIHTSILTIKEKTKNVSVFTFNHITKEDVMKEIKDVYKSSQKMTFLQKYLRKTLIFYPILYTRASIA